MGLILSVAKQARVWLGRVASLRSSSLHASSSLGRGLLGVARAPARWTGTAVGWSQVGLVMDGQVPAGPLGPWDDVVYLVGVAMAADVTDVVVDP